MHSPDRCAPSDASAAAPAEPGLDRRDAERLIYRLSRFDGVRLASLCRWRRRVAWDTAGGWRPEYLDSVSIPGNLRDIDAPFDALLFWLIPIACFPGCTLLQEASLGATGYGCGRRPRPTWPANPAGRQRDSLPHSSGLRSMEGLVQAPFRAPPSISGLVRFGNSLSSLRGLARQCRARASP